MSRPLLSICIPTHNRADLLRSALLSLAPQVRELGTDVEVVVSDNASTDNTKQVVKSATKHFQFRYNRNAKDIGLCPNIVQSTQLARGEFCWTLGDDDLVKPGGIKKVVQVLKKYPEIDYVYVNFSHIAVQELRRLPCPALSKDLPDNLPLGNEDPSERYVPKWEELIDPSISDTFLGSMQPSVTRRSYWSRYSRALIHGEFGSSLDATYPHVRILGSALVGKKAYYIGKPCFVVVEGLRGWWGLVSMIRLVRLNDVLDFYERVGVDPGRIYRCREYLLSSSGPLILQMLTKKSTPGREYFSATRFFLRFWRHKVLWSSLFRAARAYRPPVRYAASALIRVGRRV